MIQGTDQKSASYIKKDLVLWVQNIPWKDILKTTGIVCMWILKALGFVCMIILGILIFTLAVSLGSAKDMNTSGK